MRRKLSRRLLFISVILCLVTLVAYILSVGSARARRPGGEGDGQSVEPFTTPTLELTGSGWLDERPPLPASITSLLALDPVDCGTMRPPIIGYEISRGQDPGEEVDFLNDLMAQGYSLGTVDLSTNAIPPCIEILIVQGLAQNVHLSTAYDSGDGDLLKSWTADGHGLMLNGDWGSFKTGTQTLFQAYGYSQLGGVVVDPTDFDPAGPAIDPTMWVIYQPDNFASHPILAGVTSLQLQASSWLTPAANAMITTDADAGPPGVPVMAFIIDNVGCAVLTTDSNWNATNDGTGGYAKQDNARVARQMIEWLNDCTTVSPASSNLYLPLILRDFFRPPGFPLFIGPAIPSRPIAFQGEVFYTTSVQIPGALPVSGKFYFSSEPNLISPVVVDDDLVILLDGSSRFTFHFSPGGQPVQPAIVEIPRTTMEQLAGQTVTIEYRDIYAGVVYASEIWLIWTP